jgi:hemerythrin
MDNINTWENGLVWLTIYETGYADIDNQNKKLFRLVNDLIESCKQKDNKVRIEETLLFLADYTKKHFANEERIAVLYRYPLRDEHKKMHESFTKTVVDFIEKYEKDNDSKALFSVVNKVAVHWLVMHIQYEDLKIAEHIKKYASPKNA